MKLQLARGVPVGGPSSFQDLSGQAKQTDLDVSYHCESDDADMKGNRSMDYVLLWAPFFLGPLASAKI